MMPYYPLGVYKDVDTNVANEKLLEMGGALK